MWRKLFHNIVAPLLFVVVSISLALFAIDILKYSKDNNITIIDNLSTGNIKNLKAPEHENLNFINGDICNTNFDDITSDIDYIFHLAAMASVPLSVERPKECNEINLNATVKLLKSAADNDVKKIVFSSSSAVYGENRNMPLKETEPLMPTSPYAAFHVRQSLKFTVVETLAGLICILLAWTVIVPIAVGIFMVVLFVCKIICFFSDFFESFLHFKNQSFRLDIILSVY